MASDKGHISGQAGAAEGGGGGAAPHAPLLGWYAAPERRQGFVQGLFDGAAGSYDAINQVMSLGTGAWYRRQCLRRAGLCPGDRVLDVAVGTGLVAREAAGIVGPSGLVAGLDLSWGMLSVARRSLPRLPLVQAGGEALPLRDASVDFVSTGYALRHFADLGVLFGEFRRVLRPGGRVLLLELGRPDGRFARGLARFYLGGVVPALSRLQGRRAADMMRYYWDTIEACVPPGDILRHLGAAGLAGAECRSEFGGLFRAYTARLDPA